MADDKISFVVLVTCDMHHLLDTNKSVCFVFNISKFLLCDAMTVCSVKTTRQLYAPTGLNKNVEWGRTDFILNRINRKWVTEMRSGWEIT